MEAQGKIGNRNAEIVSSPLSPRFVRGIEEIVPVWYGIEESGMDGTIRSNIQRGIKVSIVLKKDQRTGVLTNGTVKDILTASPQHPHGIKVRLESGEIGRVKKILF